MLILLGGSFDPVHNGHLYIAHHLQQLFSEAEICFVPCKQPVIEKHLYTTASERMLMLQVAIKEKNLNWRIDSRELDRVTPSYTQETLASFRKEYPGRPIVFVMGSDVFAKLDQEWGECWQALITGAHVMVIERVTQTKPVISPQLQQWLKQYQVEHHKMLESLPSGRIYRLDIQAPYISSTAIRRSIRRGEKPKEGLLPDRVLAYIYQKKLYKPIFTVPLSS